MLSSDVNVIYSVQYLVTNASQVCQKSHVLQLLSMICIIFTYHSYNLLVLQTNHAVYVL